MPGLSRILCGNPLAKYWYQRATTSYLQALEYHYRNLDLACLLYTSPSPRDGLLSRMPSSA